MVDIKTNVLYFGDNLQILRNRDYFPDGSVDLIYLDPPFNSRADYNVLFREPTGERSAAQIKAFSDTWHWDDVAISTYADIQGTAPENVRQAIKALHQFIHGNDVMAYLVMMTARLVELHRVLKNTGSLYLHCDPAASHYLKVILDTIFGPRNFRNEVVWKRSYPHGNISRKFGAIHDVLFFYVKSGDAKWNQPAIEHDHSDPKVQKQYSRWDPVRKDWWQPTSLLNPNPNRPNLTYEFHGHTKVWRWTKEKMLEAEAAGLIHVPGGGGIPRFKRYLSEQRGRLVQDVWTDIVFTSRREDLGYETQKPLALLERIIAASSNEGAVVLDPFCGCGTAVVAAQKLDRRWIGIDVTNLAIAVMCKRLEDGFPGIKYEVIGEPTTLSEARALAEREPDGRYQFQYWAVRLVGAQPRDPTRKKGADKGVDGLIAVHHDNRGKVVQVVVQVKSGQVHASDIRDLKGTSSSDRLGVFITLERSTQPMIAEARSAGLYHNELMDRDYPRIQILSIEELLGGKQPLLPPRVVGQRAPLIGQVVPQGKMQVE